MKLFLDQKARRFIKSAASNVALQSLVLKRRDQVPIEVVFVENGVAIDPVLGTQTTVALKSSFSDSNFLALAAPGSTILDLNTVPVEGAFSSDPASISAYLEIRWTAPTQALRTATLQVEVQNSVILGDEATPAALPDGKATQAEAEAGLSNEKWMTPLRTAQAITALADATFYGTTAPDPAQYTRWVHTDLGRLFTWFEGAWVEFTHSTAASSTSTVTWTDVIGKPATFAPSTHTHTIAQVDGLQAALDAAGTGGGTSGPTAWADITGKPLTFAPSTHSHAIADTTGLQTALDGKAATTHTHAISDTTGLQTALDGKQPSGNYSLNGHTHTTANVTGLDAALAGKVSGSGVASISVVQSLPATLVPTTFYIVIPSGATTASAVQLGSVSLFTGDGGGDDGGGGGGGGDPEPPSWAPTTLANLALWLDATSGLYDATTGGAAVTANGAYIARWEDRSGNARHFSQATVNSRPTLATAGLNSKATIFFDGTDDFLDATYSRPYAAQTLFLVVRVDLAKAQIGIFAESQAAASDQSLYLPAVAGTTSIGSTTDGSATRRSASAYTLATYYIATFTHSGTTIANYLNGVAAVAEGDTFPGGTYNVARARLGGRINSNGTNVSGVNLQGSIGEVIAYDRLLTTSERDTVHAYLSTKWGIAL
jgi:hypothetical protein